MKFSIILPFYGSLGELKRTLKSISSQTISDYELILIDDNKIYFSASNSATQYITSGINL